MGTSVHWQVDTATDPNSTGPRREFQLLSIPLSEQRDVAALRSQGLSLCRWGQTEDSLAEAFIGTLSAITQAMIDSGDPGHAEFSLARDEHLNLIQIELCIHPESDQGPGPRLSMQLRLLAERFAGSRSYHRTNGEIVQQLQVPIVDQIEVSAETALQWRERLLNQSDYSTFDLLRLQNHELTRAMERRRRQEQLLQSRVAEIEKLNAELRDARRVAEEAAAGKAQFLAHMSHEIRTPMNAIVGMIEVLREEALTPQQRNCVGTIRTSSQHLLHLINNVLDYSKLNADQFQLENKGLSVYQLVEASIEMAAVRAAETGLDLGYRIDDKVPDRLLGDAVRIRQILDNYLSNAIKFTRQGSVQVFVTARPQGDKVELEFCVADTGPGMDREVRDRLFVDYVQADAGTGATFGGTGLGLAISRKLAAAMGGRTWVESTPGEGSRFYFTITANRDRREAAFDAEPMLDGLRLLAVTGNALVGESVQQAARRAGMIAEVTAAPDDVMNRLTLPGRRYDLVLVDQQLPESVTHALARRIASLTPAPRLVPLCPVNTTPPTEPYRGVIHTPLIQSRFARRIARILGHSELAGQSTERRAHPARARPSGNAQPAPHSGDEAALRILLVEDNPVNRQVAILMLKQLGYDAVATANSGEVALEMIHRQSYDVVLMDIQMDGIDGLETTRRMRRELPRERQPWIIAMTANVMAGDREACTAAGMNDYLSKPVVRRTLGQALAEVRERRQPE